MFRIFYSQDLIPGFYFASGYQKIKACVIQQSIVSRVIIDRNTLKIVKYIRVEQRFGERHRFPKF